MKTYFGIQIKYFTANFGDVNIVTLRRLYISKEHLEKEKDAVIRSFIDKFNANYGILHGDIDEKHMTITALDFEVED